MGSGDGIETGCQHRAQEEVPPDEETWDANTVSETFVLYYMHTLSRTVLQPRLLLWRQSRDSWRKRMWAW